EIALCPLDKISTVCTENCANCQPAAVGRRVWAAYEPFVDGCLELWQPPARPPGLSRPHFRPRVPRCSGCCGTADPRKDHLPRENTDCLYGCLALITAPFPLLIPKMVLASALGLRCKLPPTFSETGENHAKRLPSQERK